MLCIMQVDEHEDRHADRQARCGKRPSMGHSQAEKAASRERILEVAARQIREGCLESLSIAELMRAANLTHGGFYGHFPSRSALIAAALERALAESDEVFGPTP